MMQSTVVCEVTSWKTTFEYYYSGTVLDYFETCPNFIIVDTLFNIKCLKGYNTHIEQSIIYFEAFLHYSQNIFTKKCYDCPHRPITTTTMPLEAALCTNVK